MAHTPGPWKIAEQPWEWTLRECGITQRGSDPPHSFVYATDARNPKHAEEVAITSGPNASLVAAAPDLLAACEAALSRIESDIESRKQKTNEGVMLRAAIAKAKGQ